MAKVFDVHMVHFIGDIGHIDATREKHWVPRRLFKITDDLKYPLHSHPILEGTFEEVKQCDAVTIWHLGHLPIGYMDYILKRYKQHAVDSVIHTPQFLKQWKLTHLFGQYPKKDINPVELPKQICDRYEIDKDEFYFANRGLEVKHFIMMKEWINSFDANAILDIGCGLGNYGQAASIMYSDINYMGIDKSKWAVENTPFKNLNLVAIDAEEALPKFVGKVFDLVMCVDILEHLDYKKLDSVLKDLHKIGKNFIFSIPFLGDPNLESDKTHKIKESKEWWVAKLSEYFKVEDAPKEWLFSHQILVGEKK